MVGVSRTLLVVLLSLVAISLHGCGSAGNEDPGGDNDDKAGSAGNEDPGGDNDDKAMSKCINWVHECQGGNAKWCATKKQECEKTSLMFQQGALSSGWCLRVLGSDSKDGPYCMHMQSGQSQSITACRPDVGNSSVTTTISTHCSSSDSSWCANGGKQKCFDKLQEKQKDEASDPMITYRKNEFFICVGGKHKCQDEASKLLPSWKSDESTSLLDMTRARMRGTGRMRQLSVLPLQSP